MTKNHREWARNFKGTAKEFIEQAHQMGLPARSIKYWVKFNWNMDA